MESAASTAVSVGASGPGYPDSIDSSPRSRGGDSWDEPFPSSAAAASSRLRVMCSYGGRIVPRPTDKYLCYLGGETRMVVIDRHSSLADLSAKLSRDLLGGRPFSFKYQLPNEDLDSLISVATDEDLENMIEELDRISATNAALSSSGSGGGSTRSPRLRIFLFPSMSESAPSSAIGSLVDESKSETWFVDALNSAIGGMGMDDLPRGVSTDSASVNCLLGLEDDSSVRSRSGHTEPEQLALPRPDSSGKLARHGQDVHSVPGSPMLDKASSFGSTSSAPSLSNLPPIPVPTDDRPADHRITGIDGHFAHMNLSSDSATSYRPDEGFKEPSNAPYHQPPPPIPLPTASPSASTISPTENQNRVFSDDEKSDHGGIRRPPQPPKPTQIDAPSSDPASRPMYLNPNSDPKVSSDPSYRFPVPDASGYVLSSTQTEQLQQQQSHPHLHQQQPHFIQANPHYMHHPVTGTVLPVPSYYSIAAHPMQQSLQAPPFDPQMPMYYMPIRHPAAYTMGAVPPNLSDPSSIPSSGKPVVSVPRVPTRPDLPASLYGTAAPAPAPTALQPQLIHVAANQAHPYAGTGYPVMQHSHLSQPPATVANYGYEVSAAAGHPQMYYSQAASQPALTPQYQQVSSTAVIPEAAATRDSNTSRAS